MLHTKYGCFGVHNHYLLLDLSDTIWMCIFLLPLNIWLTSCVCILAMTLSNESVVGHISGNHIAMIVWRACSREVPMLWNSIGSIALILKTCLSHTCPKCKAHIIWFKLLFYVALRSKIKCLVVPWYRNHLALSYMQIIVYWIDQLVNGIHVKLFLLN